MKTLSKILCAAMFSIGLSASAQAAPGDGLPGDAQSEPRITLFDGAKASCAARGSLCVTAGAATTRPVAEWLVGASGAPIASDSSSLFLRVLSENPSQRFESDAVPWTLDVNTAFRRHAVAGNALFIFTDLVDAEQTAASHTVTALYQTPIATGDQAAVRILLSPQDGFRAGHTYRLRVVQLIDGKEVELSSGEIGICNRLEALRQRVIQALIRATLTAIP